VVFRVCKLWFRVWGVGCRGCMGCGVWASGFGLRDSRLGFGAWGLRFGSEVLGGIWGLGFLVWAFAVWGLRFGV
jgi:hypothetical protein